MEMEKFLEQVASDRPTPGGGSVSALAGALSASLVAMVAALSLKKNEKEKKELKETQKRAKAIQRRLIHAVDEDAKSFEAVMKAFRLPRGTEKERFDRTRAIQKAYQNATQIPCLVCERAIQLLADSKCLILKGNPNALSDAGVAAFLADAAFAGGLLNIGINLVPITEKAFVKRMRLMMSEWTEKRDRLMRDILKSLKPIR